MLCMSRTAYFISRIDWLVRVRPAQRQRQVVRVGPRRHAPRAQAAGWARAGTRHVRRRQTRAKRVMSMCRGNVFLWLPQNTTYTMRQYVLI